VYFVVSKLIKISQFGVFLTTFYAKIMKKQTLFDPDWSFLRFLRVKKRSNIAVFDAFLAFLG
jgi:hypothetical protein